MRRAILAGLVCLLAFGSSASAGTGLTWSGFSWHVYSGTGGLGQKWSPTHVSVSNGVLHIAVSGGVGGGVSMGMNRTYGTYQVRMRMSKGTGKPVVLLWPQSGKRPEIDFAEGPKDDPMRKTMTATWHPDLVNSHETHYHLPIDYSVWHTYGVVWRSGGLAFTVDGRTWAHQSASSHKPMHVAIAANYKSNESKTPAATLDVAWIHVS